MVFAKKLLGPKSEFYLTLKVTIYGSFLLGDVGWSAKFFQEKHLDYTTALVKQVNRLRQPSAEEGCMTERVHENGFLIRYVSRILILHIGILGTLGT